jgi:hypothetical protein
MTVRAFVDPVLRGHSLEAPNRLVGCDAEHVLTRFMALNLASEQGFLGLAASVSTHTEMKS